MMPLFSHLDALHKVWDITPYVPITVNIIFFSITVIFHYVIFFISCAIISSLLITWAFAFSKILLCDAAVEFHYHYAFIPLIDAILIIDIFIIISLR